MNQESDGERAVRVTLDTLGIKYEQEKEINFLQGDYKRNRRVDFFLPKYNLYIEYLGGWDKKNYEDRKKERKRYNSKKNVYNLNDIKCIYIYPKQLNYISSVIQKEIERYGNKVVELPFYKNPLIISIATIFIFITSILFSIFRSHTSPLFSLIILILFFINIIFIIIFKITQCPNCKRVFAKKHIKKDFIKTAKRPWAYRIETKYLYSDGSYKNSTYSKWKERIESINIYKNTKQCKYCRYRWTEIEEVNLDKNTRPQTIYRKRTNYKNPANKQSTNIRVYTRK